MLKVKVADVDLKRIGSYDELAFSHEWPHGSALVSWVMRFGISHLSLRAGALVEVFDGGVRIWIGRLSEPSASGEFHAVGLWQDAKGVYALDGSGNATNTPDTAIDRAITDVAVSWTRPASLSAASWGTASEPMDLLQLLDESMAGLGLRWYVDPDGAVRASADPTTPKYYVPHAVAGHGLALAEDNYFTHLIGRYLSGVGTYATVTVGTGTPRKEGLVDLTPMGVITAPTATTELTNRLALTGARRGFAEGLELSHGQITTPGGTAVSLTTPRAGEMVRLMGVTDLTRTGLPLPYTDIVIGSSSYKEGDGFVRLNPVGMAARNLTEALKVAVA
jgi:hypothetical protein